MSPPLRLSAQMPALVQAIRQQLDTAGVCLVTDLALDAAPETLAQLTARLGTPLLESRNLQGGSVCRIAAEAPAAGVPYANTAFYFGGHTDCADFLQPPDTVLLLCERAASQGGDSLIAEVNAVLDQLDGGDLLALQEPVFVFRDRPFAILSRWQGYPGLRYNRVLLSLCQRLSGAGHPEQEALWDRLDAAIAAVQTVFPLRPGECLVLDNQRRVHGRTAFTDDGQRLYWRSRLQRTP